MPTPESIFIELRRLAEDESMEPYKAQTLIDAAAALEDMAQVLQMVDDNQRIARLIAALQEAREGLSRPARVGLTECNTNDSPWLICKTCAAAGRCAKTAPQKAMTADQIERYIGVDEDDREAVAAIVREVEAWHGIERAHNIPAAQEGK